MIACGAIVLACLIAYSNSFAGAFVYDDRSAILENPSLRHARTWLSPPSAATVEGRPLLNASLALNYAIDGLNIWSYHLANLLIHMVAAVALFGIIRQTLLRLERRDDTLAGDSTAAFRASALALVMALFWAVHPLQTESVTYIVQRAESLMGMFYLLTLYCAIRAWDAAKPLRWSVAAVLCCALGMGVKEVMATAPLLVVLYDRCFLAESFRQAIKRRWKLYLGLFATWAVLAGLLSSSAARAGTAGFSQPVTWWQYALTQCGVILHYLRLAFWPSPLVLDYFWPPARAIEQVLPGLIVIAALLGVTVWGLICRKPWAFLGTAFFLVLAPTSSIYPISDPAFEHRMYLPLAAVVAAAVLAARWIWLGFFVRVGAIEPTGPVTSDAPSRWAAPALAALLVAALLTCGTIRRNQDYRSELAIWRDTLVNAPANPRAHLNMGMALEQQGRVDEAIQQYEQALRLRPGIPTSHNNLGVALTKRGRLDEAIEQYELALKGDPKFLNPRRNLALALVEQRHVQEGLEQFREALRIDPQSVETLSNYGGVLVGLGNVDEAIFMLRRAIAIQPDYADAHNNLGLALARQGHRPEAVEEYRQVVRLEPSSVEAHLTLGVALAELGQFEEARGQFQAALRLEPKNANAQSCLEQLQRVAGTKAKQ